MSKMLGEICHAIKNWFPGYPERRYIGDITISGGIVSCDGVEVDIEENQFFRVVGSKNIDGVYQYSVDELPDESYHGGVWFMYIPPDFLSLVAKIQEWFEKYGGIESNALTPYNSESFGGYSYNKGAKSGSGGADGYTWQGVFAADLAPWRKI